MNGKEESSCIHPESLESCSYYKTALLSIHGNSLHSLFSAFALAVSWIAVQKSQSPDGLVVSMVVFFMSVVLRFLPDIFIADKRKLLAYFFIFTTICMAIIPGAVILQGLQVITKNNLFYFTYSTGPMSPETFTFPVYMFWRISALIITCFIVIKWIVWGFTSRFQPTNNASGSQKLGTQG